MIINEIITHFCKLHMVIFRLVVRINITIVISAALISYSWNNISSNNCFLFLHINWHLDCFQCFHYFHLLFVGLFITHNISVQNDQSTIPLSELLLNCNLHYFLLLSADRVSVSHVSPHMAPVLHLARSLCPCCYAMSQMLAPRNWVQPLCPSLRVMT